MDDKQFWNIIKQASSGAGGDVGAIVEAIHDHLTELPAVEIESFDGILRAKINAAYTWKLWGAAYLMNGGCSDDGFEYFRGWLVTHGQKFFEAAVANPDSLAKGADPEDDANECEEILYVAKRAYETVAGKELPAASGSTQPREPLGERWDFDDQEVTAQQLPRLSRKYGA